MLKGENICYKHDGREILSDVSVAFEAGTLNLILGPNGAGKSTLVKILSGYLKPQQGSVYVGEKAISAFSLAELAKVRAVMSQNSEVAFPIQVKDLVMMGRYPHFGNTPTSLDRQICEEVIHLLELDEFLNRDYQTLSGGERQRVHFARALVQIWQPVEGSLRYLILDEPLTFLDVYYQIDFLKKLKNMLAQKNLVIVGIVHDLSLAARYGDYFVVLHKGKLVVKGSKQEVITTSLLKSVYHIDAQVMEYNGVLGITY